MSIRETPHVVRPPIRNVISDGGIGLPVAPKELVWLLYDEFTTDESAPLTSPRTCEPGPGTAVIVDTTNKFAISGGDLVTSGVNAAGDPGIWVRLAGPTEFTPEPGQAAFFDVTLSAGNQIELGFDANTSSFLSNPYFKQVTTLLKANNESPGGVDVDLINLAVDGYGNRKFLFIPRSAVRVHYYVIGGKLYWVGTAEQGGTVNLAISTAAYSNPTSIHELGLIDLPANGYTSWDADFSTVTDSESSPADGTTFDCDADFHLRSTFTYADTEKVEHEIRFTDSNNYIEVNANAVNDLVVNKFNSGTPTQLQKDNNVFVNATAYQIDIIGYGSSIKVYLDNVLMANLTETDHQSVAGARITHTLTTNDIELSTHPYPALGIADSRIIAPQESDTATHEADCLCYMRGVTLPTSGVLQYEFRGAA